MLARNRVQETEKDNRKAKKLNMKKYDISLSKQKKLKAIRSIYFGGEALRRVEIWHNGAGEPETVRVIYSGRGKQK